MGDHTGQICLKCDASLFSQSQPYIWKKRETKTYLRVKSLSSQVPQKIPIVQDQPKQKSRSHKTVVSHGDQVHADLFSNPYLGQTFRLPHFELTASSFNCLTTGSI